MMNAFILLCAVFAANAISLEAVFEPKDTNGFYGRVHATQHESTNETKVLMHLDFAHFDWTKVEAAYPACFSAQAPIGLLWHVHVIWENLPGHSSVLAGCSLANAGNHYDPTYACGPNSQYIDTQTCKEKTTPYQCTPQNYREPRACEEGDLSARQGPLSLPNKTDRIEKTFTDFLFPSFKDYNKPMPGFPTVHWNWILHLQCAAASNPRLLCAKIEAL